MRLPRVQAKNAPTAITQGEGEGGGEGGGEGEGGQRGGEKEMSC